MVKNIVLPAVCLLPLVAAQAADANPNRTRPSRSEAAPKVVALEPPTFRQIRPAPLDFGDGRLPFEREYRKGRRAPQLLGALAPADNMVLGLGLWRVDKVSASDPNRAHPMRETRGRTTRVAAVGFNLSF